VCDRIVVFEGHRRLVGQMLPIEITQTNAFTLFGQAATVDERLPAAVRP
jgi:tRNA-2-methylthio-N6-dimethylallyladenosine synthase